MIRLTIKDEEVIAMFSRAPERQKAGAREAMNHIASRLYDEVENLLSGGMLQRKTGRLADAQHVDVTDTGTSIRATVGFNREEVPYGQILIEGVAKSWDISANSAKALRFKIGAEVVFAKHVTHPPAPPRDFLSAALAIVQPEILPAMREAVRNVST